MEGLPELLSSGHMDTIRFFFTGLRDVTSQAEADEIELAYNASVLAHFAQTSTATVEGYPTPATLGDVFDRFIIPSREFKSFASHEEIAGQCLLLTGFFGNQMERRHNVEWYARIGAERYDRAATISADPAHRQLMNTMSHRFKFWRKKHAALAKELREQQYLLKPS